MLSKCRVVAGCVANGSQIDRRWVFCHFCPFVSTHVFTQVKLLVINSQPRPPGRQLRYGRLSPLLPSTTLQSRLGFSVPLPRLAFLVPLPLHPRPHSVSLCTPFSSHVSRFWHHVTDLRRRQELIWAQMGPNDASGVVWAISKI